MGIKEDLSDLEANIDSAVDRVKDVQTEFDNYLKTSVLEALCSIEDLEGQVEDLKDQIADKDGEISGLEHAIRGLVEELDIANTIQQNI